MANLASDLPHTDSLTFPFASQAWIPNAALLGVMGFGGGMSFAVAVPCASAITVLGVVLRLPDEVALIIYPSMAFEAIPSF